MTSAGRALPAVSDLLRADPFDAAALGLALQRLGLAEAGDFRSGGKPTTSRAEKLIDGLARNALERIALYAILDALLADIAAAAEPLRALLNFSRLVDAV